MKVLSRHAQHGTVLNNIHSLKMVTHLKCSPYSNMRFLNLVPIENLWQWQGFAFLDRFLFFAFLCVSSTGHRKVNKATKTRFDWFFFLLCHFCHATHKLKSKTFLCLELLLLICLVLLWARHCECLSCISRNTEWRVCFLTSIYVACVYVNCVVY